MDENGKTNWTDVPTTIAPEQNIACGTVDSLSPFLVAERNQSPVLAEPNGPTVPLQTFSPATLGISYSDPNPSDSHTLTIDWHDGSAAEEHVNSPRTFTASHSYSERGVYTVRVAVEDGDGGVAAKEFRYIVIYDPSAGFVTGGGWINSPAGAYVTDATLTGKANFGFVSKYQKGATVPTGQTEFQFHVANFRFKSSSYEWLVVSGAKAQYKGLGTVNGSGDYGSLLSAADGQISGGGGTDKFRIKIWDRSTDQVVYDNAPGASHDIDQVNPQAISGGSIVIHKQ